jgi:hypothetical protein
MWSKTLKHWTYSRYITGETGGYLCTDSFNENTEFNYIYAQTQHFADHAIEIRQPDERVMIKLFRDGQNFCP